MLPWESDLKKKVTIMDLTPCQINVSPNLDKSFWIFWLKAVPSALRFYSVNGSFIVAWATAGKIGFLMNFSPARNTKGSASQWPIRAQCSCHVIRTDQWDARNTKLSAQCLGCCRVCCKYWPALNISCGYRTWLHTRSKPEQWTNKTILSSGDDSDMIL